MPVWIRKDKAQKYAFKPDFPMMIRSRIEIRSKKHFREELKRK